jgi:O-antigen ligase
VATFAIIALLVLAPIPLGSNRPAFWMIWSAMVGLMALGYGACLLVLRARPRFRLAAFAPEAALLFGLCAYMAIQALPLASWLPASIRQVDAIGATPATLSFDPGSTRLVLIQFLTFGLLYFLTVQVAANRRRARRMLLAILVIIALFALYGLISLTQLGDTILGFEKQIYLGYATGTFINRNSFATFLAVGLTLGAALLMETASTRRDMTIGRFLGLLGLIVGCIVFIAAALLATGSRLGSAAGVLGAITAVVLGTLAFRGAGRAGLVLVGLLAIALLLTAVFGMTLVERLVLSPGVDETRLEAHRIIWSAILHRPWFGYGAGSFATVFQTLQRPPLSGEFVWNNSHSTYLALWFEMGLIAGSIPLLIIALVGLRAARAVRDPSSMVVSIATIGTIVVFAVHSLLDFPAEIEANAFFFTVILALGAAGRAKQERLARP